MAARSLGLAAVALPGKGAWRPEWAKRFVGRRVVVLLDCDQGSREAAERIAHRSPQGRVLGASVPS